MDKKEKRKLRRIPVFSKLGLGALLNIGFAIAITVGVFIGYFSMVSLGKVVSDLGNVATQSLNVSSKLEQVREDSETASVSAGTLKEDMNNRLIKMMRTNAADMKVLEKTFEEIALTLRTLVENEESDAEILLLEAEDIFEGVQRESLPLVRGIVAEILRSVARTTRGRRR